MPQGCAGQALRVFAIRYGGENMLWVKWDHGLARKPEVLEMARRLNVHRGIVATACMETWEWFDVHTRNGNALGVTKTFLDLHVMVDGFAEAMLAVGWLDGSDGVGYSIPCFDLHHSKSAKRRALTADRVAQHRTECNADVTLQALRKAPQIREEKNKQQQPSAAAPTAAAGPLADALADAGIGDPERSRLAAMPTLSPELVRKTAELVAAEGGGPGKLVLRLRDLGNQASKTAAKADAARSKLDAEIDARRREREEWVAKQARERDAAIAKLEALGESCVEELLAEVLADAKLSAGDRARWTENPNWRTNPGLRAAMVRRLGSNELATVGGKHVCD
jgi:hypothetical protein